MHTLADLLDEIAYDACMSKSDAHLGGSKVAASSRATARRIGIVLRAPTQIDTPFFRYVTTRLHGELNVIYTRGDQLADRIFDAELGREISWGIDLLDGYPYSVLPRRGRLAWLLRELRRRTLRPAGCERIQRAGADHGGGCSEARVHSSRTPARHAVIPPGTSGKARLTPRPLCHVPSFFQPLPPVGAAATEFLEDMGVTPDRMSPFPYTVDLDHFRRGATINAATRTELRHKYGLPQTGPVIVAVTKFHPRESPWDLLRAYCTMDEPGACLWLVGDGPQRPALEDYAREHSSGASSSAATCHISSCHWCTPQPMCSFTPLATNRGASPFKRHWLVTGPASSLVGAARDFVTPGKTASSTARATQTISAASFQDCFPDLFSRGATNDYSEPREE